MMKRRGTVWAASLVIVLSVSLTGCESYSLGPVAIARSGDDLLVTLCADMSITSVAGETRSGDAYLDFVSLVGPYEASSGTTFHSGEVPVGMTGYFNDVDFSRTSSILVFFAGPELEVVGGFNDLRELANEQSSWLQTDGTVTSEPCPEKE